MCPELFFSVWVELSFGFILSFCLNYTNWHSFIAKVCTVSTALCMHRFCIHGFNQLQIKMFGEKKNTREFQKAKLELAMH